MSIDFFLETKLVHLNWQQGESNLRYWEGHTLKSNIIILFFYQKIFKNSKQKLSKTQQTYSNLHHTNLKTHISLKKFHQKWKDIDIL